LWPSRNPDDLRIYAVSDTQVRAEAIAAMGVAEPNGILRRLQNALSASMHEIGVLQLRGVV
jgi:phosphomannomutase